MKKCKMLLQDENIDKNNIKKLKLIERMLEVPDCFKHMSIDVAISVLIDLGYTKDEAKNIYIKLTEGN